MSMDSINLQSDYINTCTLYVFIILGTVPQHLNLIQILVTEFLITNIIYNMGCTLLLQTVGRTRRTYLEDLGCGEELRAWSPKIEKEDEWKPKIAFVHILLIISLNSILCLVIGCGCMYNKNTTIYLVTN